ncbi:TPA: transposase [Bacillus pseudomycoides]|nr:transposase [Bacillus pseudomycoides]
MIITRKIKLAIIGEERDSHYEFIREERYKQNKALNVAMNHLYFLHIAKEKIRLLDHKFLQDEKKLRETIDKLYDERRKMKDESKKDAIEKKIESKMNELKKLRSKGSKDATQILQNAIKINLSSTTREIISKQFDLISDTKDRITQKVTQDFNSDLKNGLLSGDRVLRTYKKNHPLLIRGRALHFYREGKDVLIKWYGGIIFKCILGYGQKNSQELQSVLTKIIEESYKVCDSSLSFGKELILNLSLDIGNTNEKVIFVEGRVLGVDLGMKVPAYMSINDKPYIRKALGSLDDFLKIRVQMQKRRKNVNKSLISVKGGKGREKKIKALGRFKEKEKNFVTTYNHFLSHNIVKFAKDNCAGQINLEFLALAGEGKDKILRNWSYYQLQQFIEYKAKREGIEVKYIDPYLTSQTCSKCGHYDIGQRESQEKFICKSCKLEINADYNASQNIARSKKYITKKRQSEYFKKMQQSGT